MKRSETKLRVGTPTQGIGGASVCRVRSSIIGCFSQVEVMLLCPALVPPPQSGLDWQLLGDFYINISI